MPGWAVAIFLLLTCKHCSDAQPEECVCGGGECTCMCLSRSAGLSLCYSLETLTPLPHLLPGCVRVRQCGGHLLLVMHGVPVRWAARRPIWWSPTSASVWPTPNSLLMVKVNSDQQVAQDVSVSFSLDSRLTHSVSHDMQCEAVIDKSSCTSDYKFRADRINTNIYPDLIIFDINTYILTYGKKLQFNVSFFEFFWINCINKVFYTIVLKM